MSQPLSPSSRYGKRAFRALLPFTLGLLSVTPFSVTLFFVTLFSVTPWIHAEDGAFLVAPKKIYAGGKSSLTVTTFDAGTHQALARAFVVLLVPSDGSQATTLFTGATGSSGHRRVEFDVPGAQA